MLLGLGYTRFGKPKLITDGVGEREFTYDSSTARSKETFNSGRFSGKVVRTEFRSEVSVMIPGQGITFAYFDRLRRYGLGTTASNYADLRVDLIYDQDTERVDQITGPGLPAGGAHYSYLADSHLVEKVEFKASGGAVRAASVRAYEAERDLLVSVENLWGSAPVTISKYEYASDALGRREHVIRTGAAFAAGHADVWTYNGRNELTRSDRYEDTQPPLEQNEVAALRRVWQYDPIGNRTESALGTQPTVHYCANGLNQYALLTEDPNCVPAAAEEFVHDADGNLVEDGRLRYFWDAENRLVAVETREPAGPEDVRLEFDYDYMNRRVEKRVYAWDPNAPGGAAWSTAASLTRRFVWYNWLLLAELDGSNVVLKKHTWGLDLSGTLEGAGGIGGLLAVAQAELGGGYAQGGVDAGDYLLFYDANGNVGQLVDPAHDPNDPPGAIAARYEYDAYGNVIASGGAYAEANAWRFSTKWWDDETGMGYWGYRYYAPASGRWISRDLLYERGGMHLYRFVDNAPLTKVDALGLKARIAVDESTCTITITLNITLYGPGANTSLARRVKSCIEDAWSGMQTRMGCDPRETGGCNVRVTANVKYKPHAKSRFCFIADNEIKCINAPGRAYVEPDSRHGRIYSDTSCWAIAHEAGHLMGLPDDYRDVGGVSVPNPGHEGHMMGDYGGSVVQHEIDDAIRGMECPAKCCCAK